MKQETQCRVYGSSQIISQILIFILIIIWWDFVFISTSQRATNTQTYKLWPRLIWIWIKKKWINSDDDSMLWTMASSRIERQKTKPVAGLFIRLAMRAMREQTENRPHSTDCLALFSSVFNFAFFCLFAICINPTIITHSSFENARLFGRMCAQTADEWTNEQRVFESK